MEFPYDEATAYHEAGHAVLALALGRPIHQVSVLPNHERLGVCVFRKGSVHPSADWVEREMLIALGGLAAEARHTGHYAWEGAGHDWQYVHDLAVERAGPRGAAKILGLPPNTLRSRMKKLGIVRAPPIPKPLRMN